MAEVKHLAAPLKRCLRCRRRERVSRPDGTTWDVCMKCYFDTGSIDFEVQPSCPRCRRVTSNEEVNCDACEREIQAKLRRLPKVLYT